MGVPCPRCRSTQTTHSTRRPRTKWIVLPPQVTLTCLRCGFQWIPGYKPSSGGVPQGCLAGVGAVLIGVLLGCAVLCGLAGYFGQKRNEPVRSAVEPSVPNPQPA